VKPLDPRLLRRGCATRGFLVASGAIGVAVAACLVAQALLLSHVVARVFLGGAGLSAVRQALLALLAVVAVRALLAWAEQVAAYLAAARVKSELRGRLLARTLELGLRSWGASAAASWPPPP
jgi:ABC-type transport system involved in cytochrome bd biosynthesis fused ATPase/permease subunit